MKCATRLLLSLIFTCAIAPVAASAPDFAGTWIGRTDVPDVGTDEITLVVGRKADGAYAATIGDSAQLIAQNTEGRDVKVDGETIAFWFPLASGETVTLQLKIAGDTMTGGWQHESGATGSMQFERKK